MTRFLGPLFCIFALAMPGFSCAQNNPNGNSYAVTRQSSSVVHTRQWNALKVDDTLVGQPINQQLVDASSQDKTDSSGTITMPNSMSVPRAVTQRFADIPNVLDAGAINDGSSDTTAAFRALQNAAGTFQVPAGIYVISNASVLTSTTHFVGSGVWSLNGHSIPAGDYIQSNLTLYVPQDFLEPNIALGYLQRRRLADGVTVTIRVAHGVYSGWGAISPTHPQGGQIQLIGDTTSVGSVVVKTDTRQNGYFFHINQGYAFGLIDGITVQGQNGWQSYAKWNGSVRPYGAAVLADNASTVNIGSTFRSDKMYYGIRADKGASITVAAGVVISNCGDVAYHAYNGGHVDATGTTAQNCGDTDASLGSGYMAEFGGTVKCETCTSTGNKMMGFSAISNGTVWAISSKAFNNHAGFLAANGGHMIALTVPTEGVTTSTGNGFGFRSEKGASMEAEDVLATGNTLDGISANGSTIDAAGATSSNNRGTGVAAKNHSVIYGSVTVIGNSTPNNVVDATSITGATSD